MKPQLLKFVLLAFLLPMSALFSVTQDQGSNETKLRQSEADTLVKSTTTKKQAKALVASAKTPEDHLKVAAYFNQEADRMEEEAKEHADFAQVYRRKPYTTAVGGKQSGTGSIFRTAEHCDSAAKSLRDAAKSLRELAAEHEQMAKEASKSRR